MAAERVRRSRGAGSRLCPERPNHPSDTSSRLDGDQTREVLGNIGGEVQPRDWPRKDDREASFGVLQVGGPAQNRPPVKTRSLLLRFASSAFCPRSQVAFERAS